MRQHSGQLDTNQALDLKQAIQIDFGHIRGPPERVWVIHGVDLANVGVPQRPYRGKTRSENIHHFFHVSQYNVQTKPPECLL